MSKLFYFTPSLVWMCWVVYFLHAFIHYMWPTLSQLFVSCLSWSSPTQKCCWVMLQVFALFFFLPLIYLLNLFILCI
jgi:hypothetical protein